MMKSRIFLLFLLMSIFTLGCKPKSDSGVEEVKDRIEDFEEKNTEKLPESSDYSTDADIVIAKIGMNNKGFVWMKGKNFPASGKLYLNGKIAKASFKSNGVITFVIPKDLRNQKRLSLIIKDNRGDVEEYSTELIMDYQSRKVSLNR